ncbi:hypothetical protein Syun_026237 [Stephania yunnanensis]|uniref:Uncharacterized protein n=1 Tax=Stephania yunnanensis TaxID=152371 RepID=A0AAP0HVJ8_9MAGN
MAARSKRRRGRRETRLGGSTRCSTMREFEVKISRKCKSKLVRPAADESGRATAAADAGPTSGGEDCGGDEAERRQAGYPSSCDGAIRQRMAAQGPRRSGARTRESGATPTQTAGGGTSGGARSDRRRITVRAAAKGSNQWRRQFDQECASRRPTGGGDGLPRVADRCRRSAAATLASADRPTRSDGAARLTRSNDGSSRRTADGGARCGVSGGGRESLSAVVARSPAVVAVGVKMGLEVKWVWSSENGF